jgi:uncharacterized membrane protein YbhN (UPF0104 family)
MSNDTPPPQPGLLKRWWAGWPGRILRVLLALLPLVWIARTLDLSQILGAASAMSPATLALAYGLILTSLLVGALRWRLLMRAYGGQGLPRTPTLFRHCLVGIYYSILPSGMAGELVRGYRVAANLPSLGTSYAVILVERVCGLIGLLALALPGRLLTPLEGNATLLLVLDLCVAGAVIFTLMFLFLPYLLNVSETWRRRTDAVPLVGALARRIPPARSLGGIFAALGLSIVTQSLTISCMFVLARAVNADAPLLGCFRVIPLIVLLSYIPLTPLGLGQRDVLALYFFGLIGVPAEEAVVVSLLTFVLLLGNITLGGLVHLAERLLALDQGSPAAR